MLTVAKAQLNFNLIFLENYSLTFLKPQGKKKFSPIGKTEQIRLGCVVVILSILSVTFTEVLTVPFGGEHLRCPNLCLWSVTATSERARKNLPFLLANS